MTSQLKYLTILQAGVASIEITPLAEFKPQWLDGYGTRTAPAEGSYLPLHAKALFLTDGETRFLLVAAEVLGFDRSRVSALKRRIAAAAGVPEEAVVLAATHTHCAPRVCDMVMPGERDPEYLAWFEAQCVAVAAQACETPQPVQVKVSQAEDRLGINRRVWTGAATVMQPNPAGTRDAEVDSLWFETEAGAILASLTVTACHPTSRGGPLMGGDYPGFLQRELQGAVGGVALFGLGCAGDVRPHFTDEAGRFRQAEPDEVERAGCALAAQVLQGREQAKLVPETGLRVVRTVVEALLASPLSEAELRSVAEEEPNALRRQWARRMLAEGTPPRSIPFELQALRLGEVLTVLFWPGEVVSDYALWAKATFPGRMVVMAYCNGAVGYVPSTAIYPQRGYEVNGSHPFYGLPAPYAPEVEATLRGGTIELMGALGSD